MTQLCPICYLPLRCDFVVCPHIGATSCAPCKHDTRNKHTCVCEEPEFIAYINKQNTELLETIAHYRRLLESWMINIGS